MDRQKIECVFIKESYFKEHSKYVKILDPGNTDKQSKRSYLFIKVAYDGNKLYVPLRKKLGSAERKYGKIGYNLPTESMPEAGLDYRYILIVNEEKYIERPDNLRIPRSQYKKIEMDYPRIEREVIAYVKGYVKKAKKNRIEKEPKYRESSLRNFHCELKIDCKKD